MVGLSLYLAHTYPPAMPNPEAFLLHARRLASRPSIILGSRTMSDISISRVPPLPIVDVHTHVYLPRYAAELRARSVAPRILTRTGADGKSEERLLILDGEPGSGRPVGPQVGSRFDAYSAKSTHPSWTVLGQERETRVHEKASDQRVFREVLLPPAL